MLDLKPIIAEVRKHAEDTVPFECCGVIDLDGHVIRCANQAKNRETSFLIPAHEMRRIMRRIGFRGFAGVYHSHVNQGAYVSAADENGIAFPGLYLVASVVNGVCKTVNCFHWNGQYFSIVMP